MTRQLTRGLGGVTIAVLAVVAGLLLLSSTALATGTVTGESKTVAAGTQTTVAITGNAGTGGIGSVIIDVSVDGTKLGTPTCQAAANFVCNVLGTGVARFTGGTGDPAGLTGNVSIGTITVTPTAALTAGQCTPVTVVASEFNDGAGAPLNPTASNGQVCIQAAATTAAPTTAAALPSTGGSPVDGNPTSASGMLTWLLVAAGLVVVSGGAWAVSRARREI